MFIGEAIDSVLNQTYQRFELIIIDNYSEDGTEKIVASYNDDRIIYLKFRNNGIIAASRNHGIKHSHGEYIAFLDSDDIWLEQKLEFVANHIKANPLVDLICHDIWFQSYKAGKKPMTFGPYTTYRDLLFKGNSISTSATVVRRQKFLDVDGFSEDMRFTAVEDYDLWLRLARAGCRIEYLHKILSVYRDWGQNISNNVLMHNQHVMNVFDAHFQRWRPKNLYYRCLNRRQRGSILRAGGHSFMNQGSHSKAQRCLFLALKQDPFNWKTWVLALLNIAGSIKKNTNPSRLSSQ
jgi:glycosyltransferase involved in cell wall biosynthesis